MTDTATTSPTATAATATAGSVIAVYDDIERAQAAIQRLADSGFPMDRVSIVGKNLMSETQLNGFVTTGDVAKTGATVGAWVGGLFGLLTGVAVLFVPGVGPLVALGPLAAGVTGAAEGAAWTGILGAIIGHFVSKKHIPKFEQHIAAGKYLVLVQGSPDDITRARSLMSDGAREVTDSVPDSEA
jgi:hypothetical protein